MKFLCVNIFFALVAVIAIKSDAASIQNDVNSDAIARRSSAAATPSGFCITNCSLQAVPGRFYYNLCGSNCSLFVQCDQAGQTFVQTCAPGTVWNDLVTTCDYTSTTCDQDAGPTAAPPQPPSDCVSDCAGLSDGDYQSCISCTVYATCSNGALTDNRPCPGGLVWDDDLKICTWSSDTCQ